MYLLANRNEVIDNLTTNNKNYALSAAQGDKLRRFYTASAITIGRTNMAVSRNIYYNHSYIQMPDYIGLSAGTYRTTVPLGNYYYISLGNTTDANIDKMLTGYNASSKDVGVAIVLGFCVRQISSEMGTPVYMYLIKTASNTWDLIVNDVSYRTATNGGQVTLAASHYFYHLGMHDVYSNINNFT